MKTPVVGIGNPVFVKGGIGVHMAQDGATLVDDEIVAMAEASTSGFTVTRMTAGHGTLVKGITKMIERVVEDFGQK